MAMPGPAGNPAPIAERATLTQISRDIGEVAERRPSSLWWAGFLLSSAAALVGAAAVAYEYATGIGTFGENSTVGWAFDITNFVFWIGIGHAGTLISAILYLFRQQWRNAVNRSAEAMTLFAVMCAGLFPLIHLGRPWVFFWLVPFPNTRGPLWINFRSALVWDVFAITTYFTISLIFWYVGLIPDLATLRDRTARPVRRWVYRFFALGWNGSHRGWHRYELVYLLLAGLATPLVLSVHTVVSFDFATTILPGWHSTIFPPYFVDGAIFSGLAMVLTLLLVARKVMQLERYITPRHIDAICKLIIVTSGIIGASYGAEVFIGLYSGNPYEVFGVVNRALGPLAGAYWLTIACNVVIPQLLWVQGLRRNLIVLFIISVLINVGMWMERFIIIVGSLERSFLPSSWASYVPTRVEVAILLGGLGFFFTCFLLFVRFVPVISIAEVKSLAGRMAARESER